MLRTYGLGQIKPVARPATTATDLEGDIIKVQATLASGPRNQHDHTTWARLLAGPNSFVQMRPSEFKPDEEFVKYLLETENVATVHGSVFGVSPYSLRGGP